MPGWGTYESDRCVDCIGSLDGQRGTAPLPTVGEPGPPEHGVRVQVARDVHKEATAGHDSLAAVPEDALNTILEGPRLQPQRVTWRHAERLGWFQ